MASTAAGVRRASTAREEATMAVEQAIDKVESAKKAAAYKAVEEHFNPSFTLVGIGSGSTVVYVVDAIKEAVAKAGNSSNIQFIPTGYQSRQLVVNAGLTPLAFDDLPDGQMIDVAFDGADEVDEDFNCVKGGGACLYQEKLVATRAKTFICVADYRKDVPRLLTNWTYVPIEVEPLASKAVIQALKALGSPNPEIRTLVQVKEGPLKTDQGFFIVKAPFPKLLTKSDSLTSAQGKTSEGLDGRIWKVEELADQIKKITGVLEVGLFQGVNGPQAKKAGIGAGGQKPIAVYFGMQDGTVKVRKSPDV